MSGGKIEAAGAPERGRGGAEDPGEVEIDLDFLPSTLGYNIRRVNALCNEAAQGALSDFNMSMGEYAALFVIGANPGLAQAQLSAALAMDPSRTVIVLDMLEKRALAERRPSPTDRRSRALYLTEAGEAMTAELRKRTRAVEAKAFASRLTKQEWADLIALLRRLQSGRDEPGVGSCSA